MKRLLLIAIISAIILTLTATFDLSIQGYTQENNIIFEDDFESYNVGAFPYPPWELVWNGKGDEYQIVVDTVSVSGDKALQLWGQYMWSSVAQRKITFNARMIGYEFYIRIESYGEHWCAAHPGFFNREAATWGVYYAEVIFTHDGNVVSGDGTFLQIWEPDVWYKVKAIFDLNSNTYDVWINDVLVGEKLEERDIGEVKAFSLSSAHAGVKVYYDDVKVFEILAPSVLSATVDIAPDTLNLKSKGRWITCYIELPEGYNVSDIDVTSILLNETVSVYLLDVPAPKPVPTEVGDYDEDGIPDLMVKFDRAEVISYILANVNLTKLFEERFMTITLTVTGKLNDGTLFQGSDTIRIIRPNIGRPGLIPR
jgi:hypothetical protein